MMWATVSRADPELSTPNIGGTSRDPTAEIQDIEAEIERLCIKSYTLIAVLCFLPYLVGEVFGARSVKLVKDVDGIYAADPKTNPDAEFITEISVADLIARELPTLPIEPVALQLLARAKLARSIRIINGLVPGNLTRALNGEAVGTLIYR